MELLIIVTGGTFDKEYDELRGILFFRASHVPEMLRLARSTVPCRVQTLMMIDSLDMTDTHRQQILDCCLHSPQQHIVITHGTDTMADTARYLHRTIISKTIVLTGAMIPYKFGSSDGLFNLGSAMAFAQALPAGVYVAMNGRFFPADKVTKNKKTGIFEEIPSAETDGG